MLDSLKEVANERSSKADHGRKPVSFPRLHANGLLLLFLALGACGRAGSPTATTAEDLFRAPTMPHLQISVDESGLAALRLHPRVYVPCTVTESSNTFHQVAVHLKGQYGTFQGMGGKPSLTLNFDKFVRDQEFHGLDKFHLNNSVSDPSYMTELLCCELFRAAGLPAARVSHARVAINSRDRGFYVLVEGHDKRFLRHHFSDARGNLYDSEFNHDQNEAAHRVRRKSS